MVLGPRCRVRVADGAVQSGGALDSGTPAARRRGSRPPPPRGRGASAAVPQARSLAPCRASRPRRTAAQAGCPGRGTSTNTATPGPSNVEMLAMVIFIVVPDSSYCC